MSCSKVANPPFCRFKKDMWEKIAKEMQLPWRAAEAMHWQIGEVEMATRANVAVFHLSGQQQQQQQQAAFAQGFVAGSDARTSSTPPSSQYAVAGPPHAHSHTHTHNLPQLPPPMPPPLPQPVSPGDTRLCPTSSSGLHTPAGPSRYRADSARSVAPVPSAMHTILPPLGNITRPPSQTRYNLPPVVTSAEMGRR